MTDTKTITFEGREYTVPVWVEWVARDENGRKCGFEYKPDLFPLFFNSRNGRLVDIQDNETQDWRDSLTKV